MALTCQWYDVPSGKTGRCFIERFAGVIDGVVERKWNSKRFLIFPIGQFAQLCKDTIATCCPQVAANQKHGLQEHVTKTFVNMLFQGKLQQTVQWLIGHDKGGLLKPDDICGKTGKLVHEVLQLKHPEPTMPPESALKEFDSVPTFIDVNVTGDVVEKVTQHLLGAAGPGGVDSISLQDWLLRYGAVSRKLREVITKYV
eukprot:12082701-Ditylum_brightwellii.AAC.1